LLQCDAEADLEQDLLLIQPVPARHPRPTAQGTGLILPAAAAAPTPDLGCDQNVSADTDKRGGGLNNFFGFSKNFQMFRFSASFPKLALGAAAALAAISLSPGSAQAFVVTVGGTQYDLSTYTFTPNQYTANKTFYDAVFQAQPWYGNANATFSFAQVITQSIWDSLYPISAIQAGSPVDGYFNANIGIISSLPTAGNMMTSEELGVGFGTLAGCRDANPVNCLGPVDSVYALDKSEGLYYGRSGVAFTPNSTYVWLSAREVSPVPGPLPALGSAAAFGFSRKLRKRINLAPGALGSALPRA